MEGRAKLLGHPIHPMLIVLPLGLFIAAVVFDALYLWRGSPTFATVAYWNIAAGVVGGLLAAVFGLIESWASRWAASRGGLAASWSIDSAWAWTMGRISTRQAPCRGVPLDRGNGPRVPRTQVHACLLP